MMFFGTTHVSGCKNWGGHPECKMEHVSDKTIRPFAMHLSRQYKKYIHERLVSRCVNKAFGDYPPRLNLQWSDMAHLWLI